MNAIRARSAGTGLSPGGMLPRALLVLAGTTAVAWLAPYGVRPGPAAWATLGATLAAAVATIAVLLSFARDDSRLRAAMRRAAPMLTVDEPDSVAGLCRQLDRLAGTLATLEHRLHEQHPVSGLPTREPLLRAIEEGVGGTVGIVHLVDLERLHTFDEGAADALLGHLTGRLRQMMGRDRLVVQMDRARLAIWFDPATPEATARVQLDALAYALSGPATVLGRELIPEVRVSAATVAADATPSIVLARAIAEVPAGAAATGTGAFDPLAVARDQFDLEQDLRRAVDRGELELHYQPLIDAEAARVCGAEALLRWRHPVHGMVSPARIVPIMEKTGLVDEIGLWALNTACREARTLLADGFAPFRIAVNVSRGQLDHQDLPTLISRILGRHALAPDALEIELTETAATADAGHAAALFDRLRALGVGIAIDDFGTGYSSFSALRTLRFDKIKIDREFVTAVDSRSDSQAICRSILALGQGLGIRILAEGVETAAEVAWLRAAGCRYFQGYRFAKPLTATELRAFARDGATLRRLLPGPIAPPSTRRLCA